MRRVDLKYFIRITDWLEQPEDSAEECKIISPDLYVETRANCEQFVKWFLDIFQEGYVFSADEKSIVGNITSCQIKWLDQTGNSSMLKERMFFEFVDEEFVDEVNLDYVISYFTRHNLDLDVRMQIFENPDDVLGVRTFKEVGKF